MPNILVGLKLIIEPRESIRRSKAGLCLKHAFIESMNCAEAVMPLKKSARKKQLWMNLFTRIKVGISGDDSMEAALFLYGTFCCRKAFFRFHSKDRIFFLSARSSYLRGLSCCFLLFLCYNLFVTWHFLSISCYFLTFICHLRDPNCHSLMCDCNFLMHDRHFLCSGAIF